MYSYLKMKTDSRRKELHREMVYCFCECMGLMVIIGAMSLCAVLLWY